MSERERWRKVRRATGYKVSSLGRVRSVDRTLPGGRVVGGQMLAPFPVGGYLHVTIHGEQVPVHHLVLEAFHGLRPYGTEGCHGPAGALDNRASELRWDTHKANERDKWTGQTLTVRSESVERTEDEQTGTGNRTYIAPQNWPVAPLAGEQGR